MIAQEKELRENKIDFAPLDLVNKIITLLFGVVLIPLFTFSIIIIMYFWKILFGDPQQANGALKEATELLKDSTWFGEISKSIWQATSPIICILVVGMLIRWLVFSHNQTIGRRLSKMVNDVPSFIAVVVIASVCLSCVLNFDVPNSLSNIALVIVGFYFGSERKIGKSNQAQGDISDSPTS